jgi:hypothetical protein
VAGWGDDDIVMSTGLSEVTNGYNESAVTWLYRQHPGQLHRQPESQARRQLGQLTALQGVVAMRSA